MNCKYLRFTRKPARRVNQDKNSFAKNEEGTAAIEFALVMVPFFILVMGIIEIALVFVAEININYATYLTARKVRTLNPAIQTVTDFRNDICQTVFFVPNCTSKMKIEARTWGEFDDVTYPSAIGGDGNVDSDVTDNFVFDIGGSNSIVTVRAIYEWDLMAKIPLVGFGNLTNGNRLITGFAAFRNE